MTTQPQERDTLIERLAQAVDHIGGYGGIRRDPTLLADLLAFLRAQPSPREVCPRCNGKGYVPGDPEAAPIEDCPKCGGTGAIVKTPVSPREVALEKALRKQCVKPVAHWDWGGGQCLLCKAEWRLHKPERHHPGCLLYPAQKDKP